MKSILAVSRELAEAGVAGALGEHIIISIYGSKDKPAQPRIKAGCKAVFFHQFDDVDRGNNVYTLFTDTQAMTILYQVKGAEPWDTCIVHCAMGVSRSPAIAAALCTLYGLDDSDFYRCRRPNALVYRVMIDAVIRYVNET